MVIVLDDFKRYNANISWKAIFFFFLVVDPSAPESARFFPQNFNCPHSFLYLTRAHIKCSHPLDLESHFEYVLDLLTFILRQ